MIKEWVEKDVYSMTIKLKKTRENEANSEQQEASAFNLSYRDEKFLLHFLMLKSSFREKLLVRKFS